MQAGKWSHCIALFNMHVVPAYVYIYVSVYSSNIPSSKVLFHHRQAAFHPATNTHSYINFITLTLKIKGKGMQIYLILHNQVAICDIKNIAHSFFLVYFKLYIIKSFYASSLT